MSNRIQRSHRLTLQAAGSALALALMALVPVAQASTLHPTAAHATLPAEQQRDGVHYVTGGVAHEQAAAFKREMGNYPLAIELLEKTRAGKRDEYTADARVKITRPGGKEVFNAKADGPFMLVKLDPGTYEVSASLGKHTLHKRHVVLAKGSNVHETFVFPAGTA
jgi:hypothetical protein